MGGANQIAVDVMESGFGGLELLVDPRLCFGTSGLSCSRVGLPAVLYDLLGVWGFVIFDSFSVVGGLRAFQWHSSPGLQPPRRKHFHLASFSLKR